MHGYFIDMKLYNRLRTVSEPFAYEEYRKRRIREKVSEGGDDVSIANDSTFSYTALGHSDTDTPSSCVALCCS